MKLEFTTTPKGFETANYLLSCAIDELKAKPELRKAFDLTENDLIQAERFRNKMVKSVTPKALNRLNR